MPCQTGPDPGSSQESRTRPGLSRTKPHYYSTRPNPTKLADRPLHPSTPPPLTQRPRLRREPRPSTAAQGWLGWLLLMDCIHPTLTAGAQPALLQGPNSSILGVRLPPSLPVHVPRPGKPGNRYETRSLLRSRGPQFGGERPRRSVTRGNESLLPLRASACLALPSVRYSTVTVPRTV